VGRWEALVGAAQRSPANIRFRDLCRLLVHLGYVLDRQRGSHHIYRHPSRLDLPLVNLQEGGGSKAKPYQVRQVLGIIETHGLKVD
jgi:HicA toxin of bacterial toxin-antitoxin,